MGENSAVAVKAGSGTAAEVFAAFLRLGLTSFGGPIAHLGYFHEAFVVRRKWLDERTYGDLVALCQFLPGPASSQVGFSIGLLRAGYAGALAAWTGFTLPSAIALVLFAYGASALSGPARRGSAAWAPPCRRRHRRAGCVGHGAIAGAGPRRGLRSPSLRHSLFCSAHRPWRKSARLRLAASPAFCCAATRRRRRRIRVMTSPVSRRAGILALVLFFLLLVGLPALRSLGAPQGVAVFEAFYRSGALVFGGGHVVLPLCAMLLSGRAGSATMPFSPATARRKPCRDRCSRSALISALSSMRRRMAWPARRLGLSAFFFPAFLFFSARCRSGTCSAAAAMRRRPCAASMPPSSASSARPFTIRSGSVRSTRRAISPSRLRASSC